MLQAFGEKFFEKFGTRAPCISRQQDYIWVQHCIIYRVSSFSWEQAKPEKDPAAEKLWGLVAFVKDPKANVAANLDKSRRSNSAHEQDALESLPTTTSSFESAWRYSEEHSLPIRKQRSIEPSFWTIYEPFEKYGAHGEGGGVLLPAIFNFDSLPPPSVMRHDLFSRKLCFSLNSNPLFHFSVFLRLHH